MMGLVRWLGVVALVVCASPAGAQEAPPEAHAIFERGEQHYEAGRFAQSLAEFERLHSLLTRALHPNAALILFNMARCYQRLGRAREAVQTFERFLADAPAGAPNTEIARVELQELRARVALDGAEPASASPMSPVGFIVAGVGAAALIASAVTGGLALAANADATAGCVDGHCPASLGARADEAHLLANVTDGLLFGGLAIAAAGVVLIFVLPGEGGVSASAGCTGDGCAAIVRGRF